MRYARLVLPNLSRSCPPSGTYHAGLIQESLIGFTSRYLFSLSILSLIKLYEIRHARLFASRLNLYNYMLRVTRCRVPQGEVYLISECILYSTYKIAIICFLRWIQDLSLVACCAAILALMELGYVSGKLRVSKTIREILVSYSSKWICLYPRS